MYTQDAVAGRRTKRSPARPASTGLGIALAVTGGALLLYQIYSMVMMYIDFRLNFEAMGGLENAAYMANRILVLVLWGLVATAAVLLLTGGVRAAMSKKTRTRLLVAAIFLTADLLFKLLSLASILYAFSGFGAVYWQMLSGHAATPVFFGVCIFAWVAFGLRAGREKKMRQFIN